MNAQSLNPISFQSTVAVDMPDSGYKQQDDAELASSPYLAITTFGSDVLDEQFATTLWRDHDCPQIALPADKSTVRSRDL